MKEFVQRLAKQQDKAIYIDFPEEKEAFPMSFEDKFTIYTLYGDACSNQFEVKRDR